MRLTSRERLQYHLAWALFWLLAFVAVFGPYLMPHQIDASQKTPYLVVQDHGVSKMINAPFPPSADHWFGTDHRGLDVLSLLLNGGRYTLGFALVVTLTRFLIAVPLGLYVGTTGRGRGLLDTLGSLFSSVPLLLILFPMFFGITRALQINNGLNADDPRLLLFTQLLFGALVLLGVFQPAQQFAERAVFYSGKLYITASRSLGASNTRLVFRHLVPHLRPEILFTFLTD
ncbi:MAG TPA: ABC transporter permease subunit, partial [Bacilli bacterium]|nr:ABC transporter permease subunit [Bacilli bacterium]